MRSGLGVAPHGARGVVALANPMLKDQNLSLSKRHRFPKNGQKWGIVGTFLLLEDCRRPFRSPTRLHDDWMGLAYLPGAVEKG